MKLYQLYTDKQLVIVENTTTGDLQFLVDGNRACQWAFVQVVLAVDYHCFDTNTIQLLDAISYGKQKEAFQNILTERNASCVYPHRSGDFPLHSTVRDQLNVTKGSKYGDCM